MKEIWIFGEGKTSLQSKWHVDKFEVPGTTFVRYFNHHQMRIDPNRIEGFNRPSLIVNVSKPFRELELAQLRIPHDYLINLY